MHFLTGFCMQVLLSIVMASSASAHPPHIYLALGLIARAVKTNCVHPIDDGISHSNECATYMGGA